MIEKYSLSTEVSRDYWEGNPMFQVTLDDGTIIVEDKALVGEGKYSKHAYWERLFEYCHDTGNFIKDMQISFRKHVKHLPSDKEGYFFCMSALGSPQMAKTKLSYLVGYQERDIVIVEKYAVPEILFDRVESRTLEQCKFCLISRNYKHEDVS